MTLDIAAIKARADKATAGPWAVEDPLDIPSVIADGHKQVYDWVMIAHIDTGKTKRSVKADRNADFIAHARTDIPDLLAALETSEAKRVKAERERDDWAKHLPVEIVEQGLEIVNCHKRITALEQERDTLKEELRHIVEMTDAENPESYRADDRENREHQPKEQS